MEQPKLKNKTTREGEWRTQSRDKRNPKKAGWTAEDTTDSISHASWHRSDKENDAKII